MNIAFFENLAVIFQSLWIMYFVLVLMFIIYALKYDMSHESLMMFLLGFSIWFGFAFLPIWVPVLIIIGGIILLILNINKTVR